MADFPPFAFTTQESWYGELSFKAAEDGSPVSLAGRQFEMHITPASSGSQLIAPVIVLTMETGRGLSLKQGDPSTLVFRVPKTTANLFPRQEYTADVLEVVEGERYLFMPVRITYAEPSGLRAYLTRFLGVAVSFAARQQPIYTPLAVPGREGRPGATILRGTVPPVPAEGKDGDYYIEDRTASGQGRRMWGPKSGGAWPGTPWTIQVATYTDVPGLSGELGNRLRLDADQALTEPLRSRGRLNLGLGAAALLNTVAAGVKALRDGDGADLSAVGRTLSAWFSEEKNAAAYIQAGDTGIGQAINRAIVAAGQTGRVRVPPGTYNNPGDVLVQRVGRTGTGFSKGHLHLDMRGVIFNGTGTFVIDSSKQVTLVGLDARQYTLALRGVWNSRIFDASFDIIKIGDQAGLDYTAVYWNMIENVGFTVLETYGPFNANTIKDCRMRGDATQGFVTQRDYAFEFINDTTVQALTVIGGDISYYGAGIYRLGPNNTSADVEVNFKGTYFDREVPQPIAPRANVRITTDSVHIAQPKALTGASLAAVSKGDQDTWSTTITAGWRAFADLNFVPNGDLALGRPGYVGTGKFFQSSGGATVTESAGGPNGRYLNVNQSGTGIVYINSSPLPVTAQYTGGLWVRSAPGLGVQAINIGFAGEFALQTLTQEWTFLSYSLTEPRQEGSVFTFSISSPTGSPYSIDIAYAGVTIGNRAPLLSRAKTRSCQESGFSPNPGTIAAGPAFGTSHTVTGFKGISRGNFLEVSYTQPLQGVQLIADITGSDRVSVQFYNPAGNPARTLAAGTIFVRVCTQAP